MSLITLTLNDEHTKLNAKMVDFAGWLMPVQYTSIIDETIHTRRSTTIFDISHMGEFVIREDPKNCTLDQIVTHPITRMPVGKCKYGFLLNDMGTVIDDLIVYRLKEDEWMLVVNAARIDEDKGTILKHLSSDAEFYDLSNETVKLDVQGPYSQKVITEVIDPDISDLKFFHSKEIPYKDKNLLISRTGYTGELGYEIYVDNDMAHGLWSRLLQHEMIKPAGLGARNILRIEAGLPLYGNELDLQTTPLDAGMERFLYMDKQFIGKEALVKLKKEGLFRKFIGFQCDGRKSSHPDQNILSGDGKVIGRVTSGTFSPHLEKSIGMGFVEPQYASVGTDLIIESKGKPINANVVNMPFLKPGSFKQ